MSSHSSPAAADDIPDLDLDLDLDLPLYDTLSHSNYYYNQGENNLEFVLRAKDIDAIVKNSCTNEQITYRLSRVRKQIEQ